VKGTIRLTVLSLAALVLAALVLSATCAPATAQVVSGDWTAGLGGSDISRSKEVHLDLRVDHARHFAGGRLAETAGLLLPAEYPKHTLFYSSWKIVSAADWSSGFFPGSFWLLFEQTGDVAWRTPAETWTAGIEDQKFNTTTHDVGFMIFCSFGNGFRLTGDPAYRDVVLQAAQSLASRFDPVVGCIRSWDFGLWQFPVIVDNMMNLEILFWAAANGGDPLWYDMALSHALKTIDNHLRADGSTYHVVDYDPLTGGVVDRSTWAGYASDSTWSRGQAWAVHGFTMAFRETAEPALLAAAEAVAGYFVDNLPADGVPYWDFDAPGIPNTERDSSAAAIGAAGLLELSALTGDPLLQRKYYDAARKILLSLATPVAEGGYLAEDGAGQPLSAGVLMHGCAIHPDSYAGGNIPDESLIWGDYYFLEALGRYERILPP